VKGDADSVVDGQIDGEFVVAATQVLHDRVTGRNRRCRGESFQSAHRPKPGLQPAVIGFHPVVGISLDHVTRARDMLIDDRR
jgi:hypothetical protein